MAGRMRTHFSRSWIAALASLAVAAAVPLAGCGEKTAAVAPPPPEVYVAAVETQDVPEYLDLVGQTEGFQDVDIRARVEGFLETMNFREGSFVRAGDLLYQIDPKPLAATLDAAKADKSTAEARLTKASNVVARYTPLVAKQAVSREELDDAQSAQEAARSEVQAAAANVEKAKLDLGYTRVFSPISGLVGTTRVKPGNLVGKGEPTLLTTVSQIDPINFRVGVTEAEFLRVTKRYPERVGDVPHATGIELTLSDGARHPFTGRVGSVDRAVNASTGTIGVKLEFPNKGFILRPGQYGRARLLIDTRKNALLVPQRAVQELQNQFSVAVVKPDQTVSFTNVKVGPRVASMWVIDEGLKPGDQVVAEGLQKIKNGMTVRTKPYDASKSIDEAAN
jgi:membrane fusion protein (multidrug efflux system)